MEKAISIDPYSFFAHHILEFVSYEVGDIEAFIKSVRFVFPFEEKVFKSIEKTSKESGLQAAYEEVVLQLETLQQSSFLVPVHMANRYARIHKKNKIMEQLELGLEVRDQNMPYIASGFNKFHTVYNDPRFITIMEKLKLPMPEK